MFEKPSTRTSVNVRIVSTLILVAGLFLLSAPCVFAQDSDGDGILDNDDSCPASILDATVIIDGCEVEVENVFVNDGCTMTDLVYECADIAENHGKFESCVTHFTNGWKKDGLISDGEKGAIQSCAAESNLPSGYFPPCPPCPPPAFPAPVPRTGQTISYAIGDDGDLAKGVAWPNPRFTDNGDGTITDNLTGLIWLKDANCFDLRNWEQALSDCNGLAEGQCGLADGSTAGTWRLPNKLEISSLVHEEYFWPAVPNTAGTGQWTEGDPFNNVLSEDYWTSTTGAWDAIYAWFIRLSFGPVYDDLRKGNNRYVWCVKGGH